MTATSSSGTDGSETGTETGNNYVMPDDLGTASACDLWAQDCPEDFKCVPCAVEDQGWDAWRCAPIAPAGGGPGSACTVTGCEDDCDANSVCAYAYPANDGDGVCIGLCMGSEEDSTCADPDAVCLIQDNFVDAVCSIPCDPLAAACPAGTQCHFFRNAFGCRPPVAAGQYGDECSIDSLECGPGLACVTSDALPSCAWSMCCSTLCDVNDPMADQGCPDFGNGQTCKPYMPNGEPVPGSEHVGVCSL